MMAIRQSISIVVAQFINIYAVALQCHSSSGSSEATHRNFMVQAT